MNSFHITLKVPIHQDLHDNICFLHHLDLFYRLISNCGFIIYVGWVESTALLKFLKPFMTDKEIKKKSKLLIFGNVELTSNESTFYVHIYGKFPMHEVALRCVCACVCVCVYVIL